MAAAEHRVVNANLAFHDKTCHLVCLCTCGWLGRLAVRFTDDSFGVALSLLSRMQGAWDSHLNPVVEVGAK